MNENELTELELEKDGLKIKLKKNASGGFDSQAIHEAVSAASAQAKAASDIKEALKIIPPVAKAYIKSPMVGTFYLAPAPDAAPFVQIGSVVEVGQVICIIEAMKLMNEIKAEVRGKISEILLNNGDPVEFSQPLFSLE